jgi:hypothetical protein
LELDDKVQTLSYEHYYPYGGTAIIAGKDKTQVQTYKFKPSTAPAESGLIHLANQGARYSINAYKANQRKLNVWVGEEHVSPHGNYLATDINTSIEFQNFIKELGFDFHFSLHLLADGLHQPKRVSFLLIVI